MSTVLKYTNNPSEKDQQKIIDILTRSFGDNIISSSIQNGFFTGFQYSYPNFILLYKEENLIGLAIISLRNINLLNTQLKAITAGPVAIDPIFQGKGYSKQLMNGIDLIAEELNAELIYLGGINNFYQRFGYFSCLAKAKIILSIENIEDTGEASCIDFSGEYLADIKKLYEESATQNTCTSFRTDEDWLWLTKYANNSFHFFKPQVVINKGNVIGYFCTDPKEFGRVREAVYCMDNKVIPFFLSGIKQYADKRKLTAVEIMTPFNSPLYQYVKNESTGTFIEYIKNRGGQLMKIVNINSFLLKLSGFFNNHSCKVHLELKSQSVCFTFKESGVTKKVQSVLCDLTHFSGLLTGYYETDILRGFDQLTDVMKIEYFKVFQIGKPFIYQGDNY